MQLRPIILLLFAWISLSAPQPHTAGEFPLRSIESLSSPLDAGRSEPVVVRGVVTLVRKRVVYIQDQTGAIAAFPDEQTRLAIGDEVEISGAYRNFALYDAQLRKLWSGSSPVPLSLHPEQAAEGSFGNRLIDTEGRLLQIKWSDNYLRLTLEGDRQIFGATLELSSPGGGESQLAKRLEEGSTLRLVGVCARSTSGTESFGNAFAVLLRSTDDIRVVSPAPWLNLKHASWLGAIALLLVTLFYRVRHRSLNLRFQAIVEERSRIAREMHDTLAQGFSGLTYQLEGLARELDSSADRSIANQQLTMALQLVRHCREEAHRSIFALRSMTQTNPDLLSLLVSSCDSVKTRPDVRLTTSRQGKPFPLSDEVINQLLRIGQEAITNALRHARASEIAISIRYGKADVTLEVSDNGKGFDVARAHSVESGHFGITGMKERAKHINGELEIHSSEQTGTTVRMRAPIGEAEPRRRQAESELERAERSVR